MSYHMTPDEFRESGKKMIDWIADYYEQIEKYPVFSQVQPGDIIKQLPEHAPEQLKFIEDHGSGVLSDEFYSWLVEESAKTVITSYSIHYTKLYERRNWGIASELFRA